MRKIKLLQTVHEAGVVAVLRGKTAEEAVNAAEKAIEGGVRIIEITMTVPGALRAIETLAARYADSKLGEPDAVVIGAGTVLDPETARAAILSGSAFIVAPSVHEGTITLCNRYRVPIMPGVMTPQELQQALELGADVAKLFPGNAFSPGFLKALKGPYPQANLMPTGGVNLNNLGEWVKAGAFAVGIGSDLTDEAYRTGDFSSVTEQAKKYVEAFRQASK